MGRMAGLQHAPDYDLPEGLMGIVTSNGDVIKKGLSIPEA